MAPQVQAVNLVGNAEKQRFAPGDLLVAGPNPQRTVVVVDISRGQVDQHAVVGIGERAAGGTTELGAKTAARFDVARGGVVGRVHRSPRIAYGEAVGVFFDVFGFVEDAAQLDGDLEVFIELAIEVEVQASGKPIDI